MPNVPPFLPTPGTLSRVSTANPAFSPLTPILGREDEIERILRHLDRDDLRLLTLLGPGGVGKTRLALELMRRVGGDFAHGARFVSLAPVRDHDLVPFAVAQALEIQESGSLPVTALLSAWLRPRHLLLVLDNMEQVIAAASPWLADLLVVCPRLSVLVTSRIALDITGEQRHQVPPLPLPGADPVSVETLDTAAAIALFNQRAKGVRPDFTLNPGNIGAVAEICVRLDGLPLAIELAAARITMLSPAEILARLTDRFALLTGHVRDAPPRLRSLRDAIGWSYDLLPVKARGFHSRLSVFVGSFSLEAAEFVAAGSPDLTDGPYAADMVALLINQSLVERVDGAAGTRFRMLETIREYGLAFLMEEGKLDTARDAHAAYYQQLAVQAEVGMKGPDQVHWLRRLEDEHGNLREALAWLTATDRVPEAIELFSNVTHFMHVRAHFTEWKHLLDGWFALPELQYRTRTRALALFADGLRAANLGEPAPAIRSLEEALDLFRELDDPKDVVLSMSVLSFAYFTANDLERARTAHDTCLPLAVHLGDARYHGLALINRSLILGHGGDLPGAREAVEEALALAQSGGDQWVIGMALGILGRMTLDLDRDLDVAGKLLHESLAIQQELGDRRNLPVVYGDLALIARIQGDLDSAESHIQTGLSIAQETGQGTFEAIAHLDLGIIARHRNELERLLGELRHAVQLFCPAHYAPDIAECLKAFAALALASGEALAAARFLGGADTLLRGVEVPQYFSLIADEYAGLADTLRRKLGQEAFDRAFAETDGWSVADATVAALAFELSSEHTGQAADTGAGHGLSPRELDVLRLMANGLTNQQIADELFLSRRTVTSHVTHILGKLDLPSRTAAVSFAIRDGIA